MHSEICPVCRGAGEIRLDTLSTTLSVRKCHGCAGGGWVCVPDDHSGFGVLGDNEDLK